MVEQIPEPLHSDVGFRLTELFGALGHGCFGRCESARFLQVVDDRLTPGERSVLRQVADPGVRTKVDLPGIGLFEAGQDLEDRGFARAVVTDDRRPLALPTMKSTPARTVVVP